MSRARLGVVLLLDREVSAEVDGLRRALGEPEIARIAPHITLIPPVNVRDVGAAEDVIRRAAAATPAPGPLALTLGPVATFLPVNPVAFLEVSGDLDGLRALRDRVALPPLDRPLAWPFVPHVTVADGIDPAVIEVAPSVLRAYRRDIVVGAVRVMEERDHRWHVIATVPLGPPAVVGRGGQPVELLTRVETGEVVVDVRRGGGPVGQARGFVRGTRAFLEHLEVAEAARRDGVGSHLLAAFCSAAAATGAEAAHVVGPLPDDVAALLRARGWAPDPDGLTRRL